MSTVSTSYRVFLRRVGTTLVSTRKLISNSVEISVRCLLYSMTHSSRSSKCLQYQGSTVGNEIVYFGFASCYSCSLVAHGHLDLIFDAQSWFKIFSVE